MPNNITNKIVFSGEKENINKVLELIKGEDKIIDFDKIVPMPKSMLLPSGSDQEFAIKYALSKKNDTEREEIENALKNTKCNFYKNYHHKIFMHNRKNDEAWTEERAKAFEESLCDKNDPFNSYDYAGLGIKNFEDLGNVYINNIIKYGYIDWYDWSIDNWGTKWNTYDDYGDEEMIEFDTAWACPLPVLDKLAAICYGFDVSFTGMWADEDCGSNAGIFECDCDSSEYWFSYQYMDNGSSEAYEIYMELKGETPCVGQDENGAWMHYDCDDCPNSKHCF